MSQNYMTRDTKKEHIIATMIDLNNVWGKTHVTLYELAKHMTYAPSTKFNDLVFELVDAGELRLSPSQYKGGMVDRAWFVCLPHNHSEQLSLI